MSILTSACLLKREERRENIEEKAIPICWFKLNMLKLPKVRLNLRLVHTRVQTPYSIQTALNPFLSKTALNTIAIDWQNGLLNKLNTLTKGNTHSLTPNSQFNINFYFLH